MPVYEREREQGAPVAPVEKQWGNCLRSILISRYAWTFHGLYGDFTGLLVLLEKPTIYQVTILNVLGPE